MYGVVFKPTDVLLRLAMIGHLLFDFSVSYWHAVVGACVL